jgi:beta-lactamase superfamily II metal-dependent hydrolase
MFILKTKVFLKTALLVSVLSVFSIAQQNRLPEWKNGFLDIHFISTGKGNAVFILMPDGTNMLIDPGELIPGDSARRAPAIPDASKSPAEWIADYIWNFNPDKKNIKLDYVLLTHYHDDHIGHFDASVKLYTPGNYRLSGVTELGTIIPVLKLVDRGREFLPFKLSLSGTLPDAKGAGEQFAEEFLQYLKFVEYQSKTAGMKYEPFVVGTSGQFKMLRNAASCPEFKIRNLFANGMIASQWGDSVAVRKYKPGEYPGENNLSCGIKITYGKFDFYTGGDINGINFTGGSDFTSMEAMAAPVIGPVDVAQLNHHGNRDSQNEYFVRTLSPRVWVGQSWASNHPGEEVIRRLTRPDVYPGPRDLFCNYFHPANKIVLSKAVANAYKASEGHIVVRVNPGGNTYSVYVLNDKTTERETLARYDYDSR